MSNRLSNMTKSLLIAAGLVLVAECAFAEEAVQGSYRSFFADRQAFRRGDLLTIIITESAAATSTARTRADKSDKISASAGHVGPIDHAISVGANNQFDGGGQIQRTGQLLGKLTVVVDQIDDNGNLHVTGEQTIVINNEQQQIAVLGTIRPEDIAPDNTVQSWRILGARIEFRGKGILARKQSPGLLAKLFDLFGLN
jgi:flagellar L-ring protein precursor FlgH